MIGKAKSISHGINDIKYISGESRHKEHPELIYHVKDNLLPCGLDAQGPRADGQQCNPHRDQPREGTYKGFHYGGLAAVVG